MLIKIKHINNNNNNKLITTKNHYMCKTKYKLFAFVKLLITSERKFSKHFVL